MGGAVAIGGFQLEGVREAVEWSRSGDVLLLLVHEDVKAVTEYLSNVSR